MSRSPEFHDQLKTLPRLWPDDSLKLLPRSMESCWSRSFAGEAKVLFQRRISAESPIAPSSMPYLTKAASTADAQWRPDAHASHHTPASVFSMKDSPKTQTRQPVAFAKMTACLGRISITLYLSLVSSDKIQLGRNILKDAHIYQQYNTMRDSHASRELIACTSRISRPRSPAS